jgi:hypothetical protein
MKKLLLLALACSIFVFGQSTTFYTWNIQTSPADTAVPINVTLDGAVTMANIVFKSYSQGPIVLSANCAAAATTCTFVNAAGVVVGNGICFAAPCNLVATATGGPPPTTFSLSAGEIALVTAVNGNTLTLKRGSIGTAVAGTSGQSVSVMAAGSYSYWAASVWAAAIAPLIQNPANGAYTAVTQAAAIAAAQAALQSAH